MSSSERSKGSTVLSDDERQLLEQLLAEEEGLELAAPERIPRRGGEEPAPLSYAQRRLWFLHQLEPASVAYNVPVALELRGGLDPGVLERALGEIVRRHESLRTVFPTVAGEPRQEIRAELGGRLLPLVDLLALGRADRERHVAELARREARRPFDLARGPLMRATLLCLTRDRHVALLTLHHIISDGWSMDVLMREIVALYGAFAARRSSPLPELPIQYADFACWQQGWLTGELLDRQLEYWRRRLAGVPILELPADRPRPPRRTFRGGRRSASLPGTVAAPLRALEPRAGGGPFASFLAGFLALLKHYGAPADVAVGSVVANRRRVELEGLIGFFVNTLVLRADLGGDPTFRELRERLGPVIAGARSHQDLPFERLVEELQPERDLSHTPLFQVLLNYEAAGAGAAGRTLPGLEMRPLEIDDGTAKFDLVLHVADAGERCSLSFEYSSDVFDCTTIERMLGQLRRLLAEAARDPEGRVSRLRLLDGGERHQLLAEWGSLPRLPGAPRLAPPSKAETLHGLFGLQAERSPDAVALSGEDRHVTYGELARRSRHLAVRLRERGVGPEVPVALYLERRLEMVTAILGVLEAGGAYVPLDPAAPPERLAFVLEEIRAPVVLSETGLADRLPGRESGILCVDEIGEPGGDPGTFEPGHGAGAAYVIYTSGSTGRPKGVVVQHGHVTRLMRSTEDRFGFGEPDVWTLFHSYSFDFSVWEIWGALLYGGRLVVVPYWISRSPAAFRELLGRERVTVLNQTPSAFGQLIAADGMSQDAPVPLSWVIFGGEALEFESLRPWFDRHGDRAPRLVNMYGITETTVHVTWRAVSRADLEGEKGSRIGGAIQDLSLRALDPGLRPAPIGVSGELCVGGAGLARGYLDRPGLTAERFVPDPYGARPGERLYRSGDLGRYRPGGDGEHLGRIDHQVKIRGFRIELGEIESALDRHPGVRAGVVVARRDPPSAEARLVAYWVPGAESPAVEAPTVEAPTVEDLRAFLRQALPDYMVPAAFVRLDELPLTSNGKVDRKALPAPEIDRSGLAADYVAPRTTEEEILAGIWARVLEVERIGVEDNFFALGGDSIRSVRAAALAQERGLELSLQDLFEHQTIAEAARFLRRREAGEEVATRPFGLISEADRAALPEGVEDAYPLTRLQAGMLYHMILEGAGEYAERSFPLYHNVDSLHLRARLDAEAFERAVLAVAGRHPVLRTAFDFKSFSEPLQLVYREAPFPIGCEDLRGRAPAEQQAEIDAYVAREARRPFDLGRAPQLRFQIHRRSDESFQLTLTENHAILDGWSLNSTITEIFSYYFALLEGRKPAIEPPLELTFRDFVAAERRALESEDHQRFWSTKLARPTILELPRLGLPPGGDPLRQHAEWKRLEGETLAGLEALARHAAVPFKSVVLALFLKVLGRVCGERDVLTGLTSHGRQERAGGEQVRGLFLNTLPFRLELTDGTWLDLVRAAFETETELFPYRRFPLAEAQRLAGEPQLFETMFNYVHFHVVENVKSAGDVTQLDFQAVEQTHFTLAFHTMRAFDGSTLDLKLEYNSEILSRQQVRSFLSLYLEACAAMISDPEARHDRASLLSPAELQQILGEWSGASARWSQPEACLHRLVAAAAVERPEAVAVVAGEERLSYGELMHGSRHLARRLRARGAGPDVIVGLCTSRSLEMVVGALGILEAGGAYLPLDPAYPEQRLALMLEDSGAPIVVGEAGLRSRLPATGACFVEVAGDEDMAAADSVPPSASGPRNLAYLIYTSGSTGRPKGVAIEHRSAAALAGWAREVFADDAVSGILASTSICFDLSVFELFLPLSTGGTVFLAENALALADLPAAREVRLINTVPSAMSELLDLPGGLPASVRTVNLAGEALHRSLAKRIYERPGVEGVFNLYGPSEDTTYSTFVRVPAGEPGEPTIGRPLAGGRAYVLDDGMQPVPAGVTGRIYLGGVGLARGYHGAPSQTAARFLPDPFTDSPGGERFYDTGDLGRWRGDGELEFQGRRDHQVKLRGFRIELGEIEAALTDLPEVREAAVLVRSGGDDLPRLVAWVTVEPGSDLSILAVREALRERLPRHMVPSHFVELDEMPLTPNGKVDRKALPDPEAGRAGAGAAYVPPRTVEEEVLAGIWGKVLGVERVGAEDDFFALGGDSIRSVRVAALAQERGLEISLQDLFAHRTIAGAARAMRRRDGSHEPATEPFGLLSAEDRALLPEGVEDAYPLTMLQAGMFYHMVLESAGEVSAGEVSGTTSEDAAVSKYPLYHNVDSLHLRARFDAGALRRAVRAVADRHPVLRTAFDVDTFSEPLQLVYREMPLPLEVEDLRELSAGEQQRVIGDLVEREARRPFELKRPPQLRFHVHRRGDESFQLTLAVNHAILDGWSLNSSVTEIFRLYFAFLDGEPALEPPLELTFRDFVAAERRALESEDQRRFWKARLRGATALELPRLARAASGGPLRQQGVGGRLDAELLAGLEAVARRTAVPFKSVLLALYVKALGRLCGERDVLTGLTSHGRQERSGGEEVRGLFLNTVPFRLELTEGSWSSLVKAAFEAEREVFPYRLFPLAEAQLLAGNRQLVETMFNYVHFHVVEDVKSAGEVNQLESLAIGQTHFTLAFHAIRSFDGGTLNLTFEYNSEILSREQVESFQSLYLEACRALVADPEARHDRASLLSPAERQQILHEWSGRSEPVEAPARGLHQLVLARAAERPDAVAVVAGEGRLSYGELARRSRRVAGHLRARGVRAEAIVGLCTSRSLEMVVGMLGILEAGGAYLPLDPAYPEQRVALMLEDSGAGIVLTEEALRSRLAAAGAELLDVASLGAATEGGEDVADGEGGSVAGRLAYVIYTSGSTGRPKGVAIEHRSAVSLLRWARGPASREVFARDAAAGVLASTSICFDLSVFELFLPLSEGGTVFLAENALELPDLPASREVRLINTVPSAMSELLDLPGGLPPSVRTVNLAGEALHRSLVERIYARPGVESVFNLYGPSEDTTYSTWVRVPAGEEREPTIGRPVTGGRAYVLDPGLLPVPAGVTGRIFLGGAGLARGYHAAPVQTAVRFLPDPFAGPAGGERLYDTGDLARWRGDGELEFLGRRDHQVKLRGFRIELGEIDAALMDLPEVREAVVLVREGGSGGLARLVAWVTAEPDARLSVPALREALRERLPSHMVPSLFVELDEMPLTPNGKIDRKALPAPESEGPRRDAAYLAPRGDLEREIAAAWCEVLGVEKVGVRDNFFDLGGHSLLLLRLRSRLREALGRDLTAVDVFRHPTVGALAEHLSGGEARVVPRRSRRRSGRPGSASVAIVGMAGRFPKAANLDELWSNLRAGVEAVSFYSDEELLAAGVPSARLEDPDYVPADGPLEGFDLFDAGLFGITAREAEILDPQHRIFLECAWEALENAAYDPRSYGGTVGVFAGVGTNGYRLNLLSNAQLLATVGAFQGMLATGKDFLPTRTSYKLGLDGPSVNVQTACSTSLVAVHLACRSLLDGECDLALAGGVTVSSFGKSGYTWVDGGINSPDGHCRPFDARGQGTVGGNGAGIVVLKRLDEAVADGDTIHAVIRGSAINNDGSYRVGFTAPSVEGQAQVIADALASAGVTASEVSFVEAHGTATALGDPIEVAALQRVYGHEPEKHCALGSIKSNIGHTDSAAGIAGLLKATLALEHGEIPPTLHFEKPNPEIDFENSPFYVNTELVPWPSGDAPRRAGVSSFGLGGTNAHVVLEEAPAAAPSGPSRAWQLLVLSAAGEPALEAMTDRLAERLENEGVPLADVAFTCRVGRRRLSHRRLLLARDRRDAAEALRERDPRRLLSTVEERGERPVTFLFPGLGDQAANMGRRFYETEATFRSEIDRCCELLEPRLELDLRALLFPRDEDGAAETRPSPDLRALLGKGGDAGPGELDRTLVAQPAVFVFEYALARQWMEWGVEPEAMIGYSLGEYVAACLAGVFDLDGALELVAERARLVEGLEDGAMLAVSLPAAGVEPLLTDGLALAALNTAEVSVVSGSLPAVSALEEDLGRRGVTCQRLRTSHAFHSPMMDAVGEKLAALVRRLEPRAPSIPYVSNLTGTWIRPDEATDPEYWARHLCETVRFAPGLGELLSRPDRILLEVGPGRALSTSARQHPDFGDDHVVISSLGDARGREADDELLLGALGRLWLAGARVDWPGFSRHEQRRRVPLPTYPFQRRRYWIDLASRVLSGGDAAGATAGRRPLTKRADLGEWFYRPVWKPSDLVAPAEGERPPARHLLFLDGEGLGERLADALVARGDDVIPVRMGEGFETLAGGEGFVLDPSRPEDFQVLFDELRGSDRWPTAIIHLWGVDGEPGADMPFVDRCFYGLLYMAQAAGAQEVAEPMRLMAVTRHVQPVLPGDVLVPEKATILGPCRVLPQEAGPMTCRTVDVVLPEDVEDLGELVEQLADELEASDWQLGIAYRGGQRWVQGFEPIHLERPRRPTARFREGGCYLITGGLGGLGRTVARDLAERYRARLVLTGRTDLPPKEEWASIAASQEGGEAAECVRSVLAIEELGGEVLVAAADVADRDAMAAVINAARERFGAIHGALHAAGVPTHGLIQLKTREAAESVLSSKVEGTQILESLLAGEPLDVFVLFSSVASVVAGLGQVDYCAANSFLDAFAHARHAAGAPGQTMSMNWSIWSGVGMGVRAGDFQVHREEHEENLRLGIAPEEGMEAFHRLLSRPAPLPQVVISPTDFERAIADSRDLELSAVLRGLDASRQGRASHARPALVNPYVAPRNELEGEIAGLWEGLLGIDEVGIHDNFFELGGDSLLGTQLISRLRQAQRVELPVTAFFAAPTVAELAALVERDRQQQDELSEIEQILAEVEGLSAGDLEAELDELPEGTA